MILCRTPICIFSLQLWPVKVSVEGVSSANHFLKIYTTYQDACQSVSLDLDVHCSWQHTII
ncbi:hypothetical protein PILCRDRAFT_323097 [Piloderma croceum F 1598]|uniref:Uncharacterized protein n=1 Tax=Piloderma croceum (strain F 1598) TaxID=765440 RepID=A0A0C3C9H8_PILCF|nr:hypothetical protein PILCRDRAFT_323097 [Piloderma croceum F 1598]